MRLKLIVWTLVCLTSVVLRAEDSQITMGQSKQAKESSEDMTYEEKKKMVRDFFVEEIKSGRLTPEKFQDIERKYYQYRFNYVPHVNTHPYVPHPWDYGFEFGSMFSSRNLYWVGLNSGFHIGTCVYSDSQSCQQYFDVLLGVSGKESQTNYLGVGSIRWQFVNFPKTYSPLFRLFAGLIHTIENDSSKDNMVYGAGFGVTSYLHPRADLRIEARFGSGPNVGNFSQVFFSIEMKVAQWLSFFSDKLESIGISSGSAIKQGVKSTGAVLKTGIQKLNLESTKEKENSKMDSDSKNKLNND